ncbi:MAG TPA: ABC transporter ATP-binding protein [Anaerolineaceae bacterium]|nr:ABC transporter ATP-binding protein [Anaerolineaceae bacterium]
MRYFVIRTEKLSKYFGKRRGIEDFSIEVEPGEVYGVLGSSGSGKTTLVRLLLDLIRPSDGRALVLGMDSHENNQGIHRQIGYLPSHFDLYPHMTGDALLRYLSGFRRGVQWETVSALAERLAVDLFQPIFKLSYGERQKIGLLQAFMHRPELVILDEPTRYLDEAGMQAFFSLVSEVRAQGVCVFLTSSNPYDLERVCDRAAVMHEGRLVTVERGVQLRARSLRKVEMHFALPVTAETLRGVPNLQDICLQENSLRCTLRGAPEALLKAVSPWQMTDFICQQPALEEVFRLNYGVSSHE